MSDYRKKGLSALDKEAFYKAVDFLADKEPTEVDLKTFENSLPEGLLLRIRQIIADAGFKNIEDSPQIADICEAPNLFMRDKAIYWEMHPILKRIKALGLEDKALYKHKLFRGWQRTADCKSLLAASETLDRAVERQEKKILEKLQEMPHTKQCEFLSANPRLMTQKVLESILPPPDEVLVVDEDLRESITTLKAIIGSRGHWLFLKKYCQKLNRANPRGIEKLEAAMLDLQAS